MTKGFFGRRDVRVWKCSCAMLALAACSMGPGEEITWTKPYADVIGVTYSVVADDLYAYGVYRSLNDRTISYVTLVPRGNIDGPEFGFRRVVPKGQVVRILSAWRPFVLLKRSIYYLVALENSDLPEGIPVRLQLDRGNEGLDADLNPAVYRKFQRGN